LFQGGDDQNVAGALVGGLFIGVVERRTFAPPVPSENYIRMYWWCREPGQDWADDNDTRLLDCSKSLMGRSILRSFHLATGFIFFSPTKKLHCNYGMEENVMSKKAAEHHKKASEHLTHAARHHGEAAKHHEAGNHEKAAHHAHTARAHVIHGRRHAEEAVKVHAEEHGKK
jgi:hypothetical protein